MFIPFFPDTVTESMWSLLIYMYGSSLVVQFSSVAQLCPTLCNPMNRSTPGLPVHHQHPESTQTRVHWVGDAIQPSHPLSPPSPASDFPSIRVFSNESALQVAKCIGASASASVLPVNIRGWFLLGLTGLISLSKGLSRVFSSTIIQKHQFFAAQPSLWFSSHFCTWLLEKP